MRFKGKMFYLFILTLILAGMSSAYGQQCPVVNNPNQEFCYLDTVGDLEATPAAGKTLRFYRTSTSTNPIPNSEILESRIYYAGNEDGSCTNRPQINVTVDDLGAPVSSFGNFFEPCVYSTGSVTTVGDLKELITPADPSFDLNVYANEFGNANDELSDATALIAGENYFIGQDDPSDADCRFSSRIAIEFNPVNAFAPNAAANQVFCESDDPRVSDLEASATSPDTQAFRWYSTRTSQPPLANATRLIDGETYYVSQIVNRTNSTQPPCESTNRRAVTVTIIPSDAGPDNLDESTCKANADEAFSSTENLRTLFLGLLENNFDSDTDNDVPTNGTFSDSSLSELVAAYSGPGTYSTTYSVEFTEDCTDDVDLAITVVENPEAGDNTELSYCQSDLAALIGQIAANPSSAEDTFADLIAGADAGGTFSPELGTIATQYLNDVATNNFPASYSVTYTVTAGTTDDSDCSDSSTLTLNVLADPDAGTDNSETLCENEVEDRNIFDSNANLRAYYLDILGTEDDRGSFSPNLTSIRNVYNDGVSAPSEDFTVTYTVDTGACEPVSSTATLTVNAAVVADAGDGTDSSFCTTDSAFNLQTLISGGNPNGVFSVNGTDSTDGNFDPSNGAGEFTIVYTVSPETACVSTTDTESFTITVQEAPDAGGNATASFCETDDEVMTAFANEDSLEAYLLGLLGTDDESGNFSPSATELISNYNDGIAGAEDFSTTYTIAATADCDAVSSSATITINEAVDAEAGTIANVDGVCSNDDAINLSTLLGTDSITGGTFSSDDTAITNGTFDPSLAGAGEFTITYTVGEDDACVTGSDFVDFTISVDQAPNAGPGGDFVFCQAEFTALAAQIAANPSGQGEELLNEFDPTIARGGTFTDNNLGELLAQYAATTSFPATFTTTYTVSSGTCTSSADYTVTINPNEDADAGDDQTLTFCTSDGLVDLTDSIGSGTFSSDDLTITDGSTFDANATGAGTYSATYTVDASTDPCVTGTDSSIITVIVVASFELGEDATAIVCENNVDAAFFTEANLTTEFNNLLPDDAPSGSFSPSITELAAMYTGGMTTGDFTTTYTIGTTDCKDSVQLTITVRENIEAELEEVSNPAPICQNAGIQDLTSFLEDNPEFGVFEGYEDGTFDPSMMAAGDYTITYTLSEDSSDCVSGTDSISFTITVLDSALAGEDFDLTVCTNAGVQNLFDVLDGEFTDSDGTFTLDGSVITDGLMDPADFMAGTYMITYTVDAENDCGNDSAMISVTVNDSPDAGDNMAVAVCQNDDVVDLFTLLSGDTDMTGSFTLDGNIITDGLMNPANFDAGDYSVTYTLENENCVDTATFTITVQDAAFAGMDMDIAVCQNDGVQNLFDFLSVDADTNGEFTLEDGTVVTDGMMDPSAFDAGTYTVTYTVAAINDCGDASAEFTITVQQVGDAPVVGDATFCAVLDPTGADLTAGSEDLTFYTDADLTMMVAEDAPLTEGTYYVTQRGDAGCESAATTFEVSISDPGTPTIEDANQTFCQFDDPTIADLNDAIDQTSNVTWYASADSTDPLSTGTALQDGVTYFASLYDPASDCDSSERLAVNVSLECDFFIPEGISPNGDQLNDDFEIRYIEDFYPNYTIEIYNRWGDSVYKGNANTPNWDGTSNQGSFGDGLLPVGVYFYYLDFKDGSTEPRRGKVYLSR